MKPHKCEISAEMVHSCRVLLGARAAGYPSVPDNFDAQHLAHGRRNGVTLDLVHDYAPAGQLPFEDRYTVAWARGHRSGRVVHNWKPVARWREADTPEARERFRMAARRVRLLDRPCSIIVHHEPENDLAQRGVRKASSGAPEEYRRMWAVVREVFAEEGAHEVVWGMAYMNYPKWDALVPDLYPGDDLVDWIWCNAYGSPERPDLVENIGRFAALVDRHGIGVGKPLGIAEWVPRGCRSIWRPTTSIRLVLFWRRPRPIRSGRGWSSTLRVRSSVRICVSDSMPRGGGRRRRPRLTGVSRGTGGSVAAGGN